MARHAGPRAKTRLFYRQRKRVSDFESTIAGRDATERRRTVGLEFRPVARISGRAEAGSAELAADDPTLELTPYDDTVALAQLAYKPGGATRFVLTWSKDLYFSTFETNLYYVERRGGLEAATYLGSLWGLQGGYTRSVASYPEVSTGLSDPGLAGQKRRDTIDGWYAGPPIIARYTGLVRCRGEPHPGHGLPPERFSLCYPHQQRSRQN